MPNRSAKAGVAGPAQRDDRAEQDSFRCGVVSQTRAQADESRIPGPLLRRADGLDVVKKASSKKGRCLLVFSCQLSLIPGGELGELTGMDCDAPVLYMSFPQGRLKFLGAVLHPKNKYMVLNMSSKHNVLCEHVFEHMIVFHKIVWIGAASDNPQEEPLPMPDELKQAPESSNGEAEPVTFGRGLGLTDGEEPGVGASGKGSAAPAAPAEGQRRQPARLSRQRATRIRDSSDDGGDSDAYSQQDDVSERSGGCSADRGDDEAGDVISDEEPEPDPVVEGTPADEPAGGDAGRKATNRRGAAKGARSGRRASSAASTPQKRKRGQAAAAEDDDDTTPDGNTPDKPGVATPAAADDPGEAAAVTPTPKRRRGAAGDPSATPRRGSQTAARTPKQTARATPAAAARRNRTPARTAAGGSAQSTPDRPSGGRTTGRTPRRAAARKSYVEEPDSEEGRSDKATVPDNSKDDAKDDASEPQPDVSESE
eukprot:jgi/Ulvmu1/10733/UM068_0021.1